MLILAQLDFLGRLLFLGGGGLSSDKRACRAAWSVRTSVWASAGVRELRTCAGCCWLCDACACVIGTFICGGLA